MRLINTSEPQPPTRLSGLYLGDAYTGKTHNLCSWPDPLLVCFDPHADTALKFPGVTVAMIQTWEEFEKEIMPHVKNRSLSKVAGRPVQSCCLDTISLGSMRLTEELQGSKERLSKPDYGRLLSKLTTAVVDLTDACVEKEGRESYHVLLAAHLKTVTQGEGDSQRVVGIRPAVAGAFSELLPRLTSFTFICGSRVVQERRPNQAPLETREYIVHTAPPSPLYVCGDRTGGGRYKNLPPTLGGTYQDLTAAWGIPSESGLPTDRA